MKFDEHAVPVRRHRPVAPEVAVSAVPQVAGGAVPVKIQPAAVTTIVDTDSENLLVSGVRVLERCGSASSLSAIDRAVLTGAASLFKSLAETCEAVLLQRQSEPRQEATVPKQVETTTGRGRKRSGTTDSGAP